jgi:flagellar biosynthesis protein FlhF
MKIKRYEANSIESALYQIRQELGPDALILHTQKVRRKGFLGLLKKDLFEVTAAIDVSSFNDKSKSILLNKSQAPEKKNGQSAAVQKDMGVLQKQLLDVNQMVVNLKKQLSSPLINGMPPIFSEAYNRMIANQVDPDLAEDVLFSAYKSFNKDELEDEKEVKQLIVSLLAARIKASGPTKAKGSRKVIALIGPTGVGKTTTLAKLAAHFALIEKRKIALITADTYRIAAVDQLQTYSSIIGIPLEVVVTPQECRMALASHNDKEIILVDTAGRSPGNKAQIKELQTVLDAIKPHETHLILSAVSGIKETLNVLEVFDNKFLNRLIISKADETLSLGQFLNISNLKQIPFSYITNGQNVPQDIEVFDSKVFAKRMFEEEEEN